MHSWIISCHLDVQCGFSNLLIFKGRNLLLPSAWQHKWNVTLSFNPFSPWPCPVFKASALWFCIIKQWFFPVKYILSKTLYWWQRSLVLLPCQINNCSNTSAHGFPCYIHHYEQWNPYSEAFKFIVHLKCDFTGAPIHCSTIHRNIVWFTVVKSFEQLIFPSNMFCTMNFILF